MLSLFLAGCSDLIEKDLNDKIVELQTPQNADTLLNYTTSFWWNEVEGASNYHLQVVQPSFSAPSALILDTMIENNIFNAVLFPGQFEWRVRALNNSTQTPYSNRSFTIIANDDLSSEQIILKNPSNNLITNNTSINFSWFLNSKALDYLFSIFLDQNLYQPTLIINDDNVSIDLEEGIYTWMVQGRNENSVSLSSVRSILVDTTAPVAPTLLFPINESIIDTNFINFSWQTGQSLSNVIDSIYIYSDSLVTLTGAFQANNSSIEIEFGNLGLYFWRVRSRDEAGNVSSFSPARKFNIVP